MTTKKTTTKKTTKSTTKKATTKKKAVRSTMMNLIVTNEDTNSGIDFVQLDVKYRIAFVERFGTLEVPNIKAFNDWKETLN